MAKKVEETLVEIRSIERTSVELTIVGETPLIMHAWSEKAKRMMLEAQQKKSAGKEKPVRSPADEFIQSMYWMKGKPEYNSKATDGEIMKAYEKAIEKGAEFGFPVTAFKQAATAAAYRLGWVKNQMVLRGVIRLMGEYGDYVRIESDKPIMREDMVKIGMGTADLRYRGEFRNWSAKMTLSYIPDCGFTLENIMNIINAGGQICGAGEWRPEKDGDFGIYHVGTE